MHIFLSLSKEKNSSLIDKIDPLSKKEPITLGMLNYFLSWIQDILELNRFSFLNLRCLLCIIEAPLNFNAKPPCLSNLFEWISLQYQTVFIAMFNVSSCSIYSRLLICLNVCWLIFLWLHFEGVFILDYFSEEMLIYYSPEFLSFSS